MFDADSIRDGSLLQHKYFTARAEFHYRLSKHTKQYLNVNSCPAAQFIIEMYLQIIQDTQ
jgi:hypothetical protein